MENRETDKEKIERLENELYKQNRKLKIVIYCGILGFLILGVLQKIDIWGESKTFLNMVQAALQSTWEGFSMLLIVAAVGCIGYLPINLWVVQSKEKTIGFYIKLVIVYIAAIFIVGVLIRAFGHE